MGVLQKCMTYSHTCFACYIHTHNSLHVCLLHTHKYEPDTYTHTCVCVCLLYTHVCLWHVSLLHTYTHMSGLLNTHTCVCVPIVHMCVYDMWAYYIHTHTQSLACGVATLSRLLKIIGLFCKRALWKRWYSAKETYNFNEPTNRSHPVLCVLLTCEPVTYIHTHVLPVTYTHTRLYAIGKIYVWVCHTYYIGMPQMAQQPPWICNVYEISKTYSHTCNAYYIGGGCE